MTSTLTQSKVDITPWESEIRRRGGEISIFETPYGKGRSHGKDVLMQLINSADALAVDPLRRGEKRRKNASQVATARDQIHLIGCDAWRFYSRQYGARKASLRYVVGFDDNGLWAVRVAGTCDTVADAMRQITPAAVTTALAANKMVMRQGDVYAIQTTPAHDGKGADALFTRRPFLDADHARRVLGPDVAVISSSLLRADDEIVPFANRYGAAAVIGETGARWDATRRTLTHVSTKPHRQITVPFPARFVMQSVRGMGRGGVFGSGD